MNSQMLKTSELDVVIGNNEQGDGDYNTHRAGYNGIWSLTSMHAKTNCFVPYYSGLNLEHLMDGLLATEQGGDIKEPRNHPMQLERMSENSLKLTQTDAFQTHVDSTTVFEVKEPHIIDFTFSAKLNRPVREGKQFGFFWASYMNAPHSPCLHFVDEDVFWSCLSADKDIGGANTVCHTSVAEPSSDSQPETHLANSFSERRFHIPLMYGRPGDGTMLFLQMFDQTAPIRLTMSRRGGGADPDMRRRHPAWDFQFVVDEAEAGVEYKMCCRVVYKPFVCQSEVLDLFDEWQHSKE